MMHSRKASINPDAIETRTVPRRTSRYVKPSSDKAANSQIRLDANSTALFYRTCCPLASARYFQQQTFSLDSHVTGEGHAVADACKTLNSSRKIIDCCRAEDRFLERETGIEPATFSLGS